MKQPPRDAYLCRLHAQLAACPPTDDEAAFAWSWFERHASQRESGLEKIIGLITAALGAAVLLGDGRPLVIIVSGLLTIVFSVLARALDLRNRDQVQPAELFLAAHSHSARLMQANEAVGRIAKRGGAGYLRARVASWNQIVRLLCWTTGLFGAGLVVYGAALLLSYRK